MNKVIELRKPQKATITITDDYISIHKHGYINKLKGENRIPFSSIASLQYRKSNKLSATGMLRFTITGNSSPVASLADDNTIMFSYKENELFEKMRDFIQSQIQIISSPSAEKTSSTPDFDPVAEIRRYKELMDEGIITSEEFEAKKQQLLSL